MISISDMASRHIFADAVAARLLSQDIRQMAEANSHDPESIVAHCRAILRLMDGILAELDNGSSVTPRNAR